MSRMDALTYTKLAFFFLRMFACNGVGFMSVAASFDFSIHPECIPRTNGTQPRVPSLATDFEMKAGPAGWKGTRDVTCYYNGDRDLFALYAPHAQETRLHHAGRLFVFSPRSPSCAEETVLGCDSSQYFMGKLLGRPDVSQLCNMTNLVVGPITYLGHVFDPSYNGTVDQWHQCVYEKPSNITQVLHYSFRLEKSAFIPVLWWVEWIGQQQQHTVSFGDYKEQPWNLNSITWGKSCPALSMRES